MGKLTQKFPSRMLDPLFKTQTYIDRRRGMADPENDRRILRSQGRAPLPIASKPEDFEQVAWGSKEYNSGSLAPGVTWSTTVTVMGVKTDGRWVCQSGHETMPQDFVLSANVFATNSVRVSFYNGSGSSGGTGLGTITVRCARKA